MLSGSGADCPALLDEIGDAISRQGLAVVPALNDQLPA